MMAKREQCDEVRICRWDVRMGQPRQQGMNEQGKKRYLGRVDMRQFKDLKSLGRNG